MYHTITYMLCFLISFTPWNCQSIVVNEGRNDSRGCRCEQFLSQANVLGRIEKLRTQKREKNYVLRSILSFDVFTLSNTGCDSENVEELHGTAKLHFNSVIPFMRTSELEMLEPPLKINLVMMMNYFWIVVYTDQGKILLECFNYIQIYDFDRCDKYCWSYECIESLCSIYPICFKQEEIYSCEWRTSTQYHQRAKSHAILLNGTNQVPSK